MEQEISHTLTRYIDCYGWSFNLARRLINMAYGVQYTDKQIRALYRQNRAKQ